MSNCVHFLKTAIIIPMLKPFNETLRLIIYDFWLFTCEWRAQVSMQLSVECIGTFLHNILSINVVWRVDPWLPRLPQPRRLPLPPQPRRLSLPPPRRLPLPHQPRWLPLPHQPRRLPLTPQAQKENWREVGGGLRSKERRGRDRGTEERGKDGIER